MRLTMNRRDHEPGEGIRELYLVLRELQAAHHSLRPVRARFWCHLLACYALLGVLTSIMELLR